MMAKSLFLTWVAIAGVMQVASADDHPPPNSGPEKFALKVEVVDIEALNKMPSGSMRKDKFTRLDGSFIAYVGSPGQPSFLTIKADKVLRTPDSNFFITENKNLAHADGKAPTQPPNLLTLQLGHFDNNNPAHFRSQLFMDKAGHLGAGRTLAGNVHFQESGTKIGYLTIRDVPTSESTEKPRKHDDYTWNFCEGDKSQGDFHEKEVDGQKVLLGELTWGPKGYQKPTTAGVKRSCVDLRLKKFVLESQKQS